MLPNRSSFPILFLACVYVMLFLLYTVYDAIPSVCVWGGVGRAIRSVMGLSIVFQMSI